MLRRTLIKNLMSIIAVSAVPTALFGAFKNAKNNNVEESIKKDLYEVKEIDGNIFHYKNGLIHRDGDLPAIEFKIGRKEWFKEGKRHRDNDKPATECKSGRKEWFKEGKRHRDNDKPAIEYISGSKEWYKNGLLHRDNGPACISYTGNQYWYKHGKQIEMPGCFNGRPYSVV